MPMPTTAMVLAAGLGQRMRPITDRLPKPLIEIGGRSLLDRALDRLAQAGVSRCVVNAFWLAEMIERHLAARTAPVVHVRIEPERLETGGGVTAALPLLGDAPFFVVNGDVLWTDGPQGALRALAAAWDDARMDALLLLHPLATAVGYDGAGDFRFNNDGGLSRRSKDETAPFLFAGLQILAPRLFAGAPAGAFSLNVLYDKAAAAGRLCGIVHDGGWCHVGTPADIRPAEAFLGCALAAQ